MGLVLCNYKGDLLQLPNDAVIGVMENARNMPERIEGIVKLISDLAKKGSINIQPKVCSTIFRCCLTKLTKFFLHTSFEKLGILFWNNFYIQQYYYLNYFI